MLHCDKIHQCPPQETEKHKTLTRRAGVDTKMKGMPVLLCADSMKLSLKHWCRKPWSPSTGIKTENKSISRGRSTKAQNAQEGSAQILSRYDLTQVSSQLSFRCRNKDCLSSSQIPQGPSKVKHWLYRKHAEIKVKMYLLYNIYSCGCVYMFVDHRTMWELIHPVHHVGPGNWTRAVRLGSKLLLPTEPFRWPKS